MGLRETIQKAVSSGFRATGNVRQVCEYKGTVGRYSPLTGWTETTETMAVQGILAEYKSFEVDGQNIRPNDQQFIVDQRAMPGITPFRNSRITDEDDVVWNVQAVAQDPAKASWLLQLRRP